MDLTLAIFIENFNIDLDKKSFDCLIMTANKFSEYSQFKKNYKVTQRLIFFKPKNKIFDKINLIEYKSTRFNHNARRWWKYSIGMIIKTKKLIRDK